MRPQLTGLIWYKEEQYPDVLRLCDDGHKLPKTYASFIEKAQSGLDYFARQGLKAVKVEADIHELVEWCGRNGHKVDAQGRMAYVNMRLAILLGLTGG